MIRYIPTKEIQTTDIPPRFNKKYDKNKKQARDCNPQHFRYTLNFTG